MLDQSALVLEGVTLAQLVQLVVQMLVDLAGGAVLDEETAENTLTTHPQDLAVQLQSLSDPAPEYRNLVAHYVPGHPSILGTLALTQTTVSADTAGGIELAGASTRVHGHRLADDQAIVDQLADGLPGVGIGDLVHLIGIEPDLPLPAADHGGREALLRTKVDPVENPPSAIHASSFPRWIKISRKSQGGAVASRAHRCIVP